MTEKEIIYAVMKESGFNKTMIAEVLGYKGIDGVTHLVNRPRSMRVESFVRVLEAMGYEVCVRRGERVVGVVDSVPRLVRNGNKEKVAEKVVKTEPEKIFEKQKEPLGYRMINGRKVVEVAKGVWRYE